MNLRDHRRDVAWGLARRTSPLVVGAVVLTGCATVSGTASPAPLPTGAARATVAATSSAAVSPSAFASSSSSSISRPVDESVVSSTAAEDVFQCPSSWDMMEVTGLDASLMSSSVMDGSKGCRYPIAQDSVLTGAAIEIFSPYVDNGRQLSVAEARANLVDIRASYVDGADADGDGYPFDIVDEPDLGEGAFSVPSRHPDGHACGVFIPRAGNRTSFVYVDNGEEDGQLRMADPDVACRTALAGAALLKE